MGPPADEWGQAADAERRPPANGASQRYDLAASARIFWDLRAQNALPLPEMEPDTDSELLATLTMPADVERLLSEALHLRGDSAAAAGALQSLSLDFSARAGQASQAAALQGTPGKESSGAEAAAAVLAAAAAVAPESPKAAHADPAEEKSWVYQDPSGVIQVGSLAI